MFRPNIVEVFDYYGLRILGRGTGGWMKAQCPMPDHEDGNPSASVNEELGKFRCFGCDSKGDGLDIIIEREHDISGLASAQRFAQSKFGSSDSGVRDDNRPSSGLLGRPRTVKRAGNFSPPWRLR